MDIVALLGNYAFPVVACVAMSWYVVKMDSTHREEVKALREAVDNNTVAIVRMIDKLERGNGNDN